MRNPVYTLLLFLSTAVYAQSYPIKQLGIERGLSNNSVMSITQDRDGFMWVATEEGLNKFDGTRFINYYKQTGSLSGNQLNHVYADPDNPVIWIATQRAGFNAYDYEKNQLSVFVHNPADSTSLITNDVTSIEPALDGNLWLSTYHFGVDYFNKQTKEFTHYNMATLPGLISNHVWTIMEDGNGNLYMGHAFHGMSIVSMKDKRIRNFRHQPGVAGSVPDDDVRCIYRDSNNNVWVGTKKGLALFNEETETFIVPDNFPHGLKSSYVFDIRQMDDNKLWVATELYGMYIIDLKQHFFVNPGEASYQQITVGHSAFSLSNPTVRAIYQDTYKNIWIGTYGGGINFISNTPQPFNTFAYSPIKEDVSSLNDRVVLSLCMDADEKLWIGTNGGGLNIFEKGKRKAIYNKESGELTHNSILATYKDSKNNIWIGTFWGGGINFYDWKSRSFSTISINGANDQDIRCFFEDAGGRMWVGTHIGLFVLDGGTKKVLNHYTGPKDKLPEDIIRSINQDDRGRMWVGTFGQGLGVYTPDMEHLAFFNNYNGLFSNTIDCIFKDSHGDMWIGTGEGMVHFHDMDSLKYDIYGEHGPENTVIHAITEDKAGNIWLSTNAGISCLDRSKNVFLNYNHIDKIPMGNFTNAVTQDNRGIIYFGSINGVRYFDPAYVLNNRVSPPAIITEMRIFAEQSVPGESKNIHYFGTDHRSIHLNYRQNSFNITFNTQDYSLVNQVEYSYRLRGLDNTWYTVDDNNVMFRNLLPGRYEFQVKTRILYQDWSDDVTSLYIRITPPLWLTWWAKTIYIMVAVLIILLLLYAYKKKVDLQSSLEIEKKNHEQEQELNNERLRFYTNIAHELRTPLTLILGPLEDLRNDTTLPQKQGQKISVVHQSALRLLNLINQIMEFRRTETQNKKLCVCRNNMATVVKEIGLKYKELNRKPGVEFVLSIEKDDIPLFFDKEIIQIILDNLISNALKYTEKGRIELALYTAVRDEVSYTEISVSDTGFGIAKDELSRIFNRYYQVKNDKQASGTGIGLSLVKNLVTLHEGEILVESTVNQGSKFRISLLTNNTYPNALHNDPVEEPQTTEEDTDNETMAETATNGKPILLVVEDNPDIRDYISDSLSDIFEVYTAGDGEEGCRVAFAHIPDIIVSDIMMPGMNGIAFTKIVKEDMRTSHIPVILLTAKDTLQDKEEGYLSGADSYLTKPFSATLLRSRINNLLENRRKLASQFSEHIRVEDKSVKFQESLTQLDNEFLLNITHVVEENLDTDNVNINFLSDKMFMSNSTLYRKVKALTGISTNEFVRKIKMKNAEQLLLEGKYTISEVSFRVGMNSPVYFRQCFKEEFGITPSEYVKRLRNKSER